MLAALTAHGGRHYTLDSTAYSACDSGTLTASGRSAYFGEAANNMWPLGTRIRLDRPVHGRRDFTILDRIGWGSQLDIFMPCAWVNAYGRRAVGLRVLRYG